MNDVRRRNQSVKLEGVEVEEDSGRLHPSLNQNNESSNQSIRVR